MDDLEIRIMSPADIPFAAQLTKAENWDSETEVEIKGLLAYQGVCGRVAMLDKRAIGICVGTHYEADAFIGELIVLPEFRDRGIGYALLDSVIKSLRELGATGIYLDGVAPAVPLYERLGFRKVCRSMRFGGSLPSGPHGSVRPMQESDLSSILDLDRAFFGGDRSYFLRRRLELYPDLALVRESKGEISGYLFGRRGHQRIGLGPAIQSNGITDLVALLRGMATIVGSIPVSAGVLESQTDAVQFFRELKWEERTNPPWRMVLGKDHGLGRSRALLLVGSPAKG